MIAKSGLPLVLKFLNVCVLNFGFTWVGGLHNSCEVMFTVITTSMVSFEFYKFIWLASINSIGNSGCVLTKHTFYILFRLVCLITLFWCLHDKFTWIYLGFYFTYLLQTTKPDLGVTLLAKQSHYSSALERSHVVLLEVQIPKAKPEGFQNSSMHITETSTGARLVMNYVGFKDSFIFSLIAWKCCKPYRMNAI